MWHWKYSVILKSKVKFVETYMKMSKYANNMSLYSAYSTVNLPEWRPKEIDEIREKFSTSDFVT